MQSTSRFTDVKNSSYFFVPSSPRERVVQVYEMKLTVYDKVR